VDTDRPICCLLFILYWDRSYQNFDCNITARVVLLAIVYTAAIEVLEKPNLKSRKVALIVTIIIAVLLNIIALLYVIYAGSVDTFHFWVQKYQRYLQLFVAKYQLKFLASFVLTLITILFTTFAYRMRCRRRLIC
jgi:hypothetical protein